MAHHEGVAEFIVDGEQRPFQFKASVVDDKLRIWIEDTVTKQQWQSKDLELKDFVTLDTAIPMAKTKDYAMRIAECLAPTSDADKPTRSLSRSAADGSRVLCAGFTLQAMGFCTALEYTFTLHAVELNPTDLLSARLRDLEVTVSNVTEENSQLKATVEKLSSELEALKSKPTSGLVCAQFTLAFDKSRGDQLMTWKPVDGFPLDGVSLGDKDAVMILTINGVYSITMDARRGLKLRIDGKAVSVMPNQTATIIIGAGDALTLQKDPLSGNLSGRVSVMLMRELSEDAVKAAKAAAPVAAGDDNNGLDDGDDPVFDAYATTGDY